AADTLHNERLKALAPLEKIAPGVSTSASPVMHLQSALAKVEGERSKVVHERPMLREFARVLDALAGHEGLRVDEIYIYDVNATVTFTIDESDSTTGPTVTNALAHDFPGVMQWSGEDRKGVVGQSGKRQWQLLGTWPTDRPRSG